jgi:hypothetical protein
MPGLDHVDAGGDTIEDLRWSSTKELDSALSGITVISCEDSSTSV